MNCSQILKANWCQVSIWFSSSRKKLTALAASFRVWKGKWGLPAEQNASSAAEHFSPFNSLYIYPFPAILLHIFRNLASVCISIYTPERVWEKNFHIYVVFGLDILMFGLSVHIYFLLPSVSHRCASPPLCLSFLVAFKDFPVSKYRLLFLNCRHF